MRCDLRGNRVLCKPVNYPSPSVPMTDCTVLIYSYDCRDVVALAAKKSMRTK